MTQVEAVIECTLRSHRYDPTRFEVMILAIGIDDRNAVKCVDAIEKRLAPYITKKATPCS